MTQRTLTTVNNAVRGLRKLDSKTFNIAYAKALEFYTDKLILRHFLPSYGRRAGWTPNSKDYQRWKKRHYGNLPQLVLTGRLKRDAKRGKVSRRGRGLVIRWHGKAARTYGGIQSRLKRRDWASPDKRDSKDILRKLKMELSELRAKQPGIRIKKKR